MKRLFTIITLLVSSFFFYSSNVFAAHELFVDETDFELINGDFITVRNYAISYSSENNCHYVIYYSDSLYNILFFNFKNPPVNSYSGLTYYSFRIYPQTSQPATIVQYEEGNFNVISTQTSSNMSHKISISSSMIKYSNFLDTNYTDFYCSSQELTITYNETVYTVNSSSSFPGLYQVYVDNFGEYVEEDIHQGEKEVLLNFYNLIIEKLEFLATKIAENYIFLSILGIFILIFVFELVRRYL